MGFFFNNKDQEDARTDSKQVELLQQMECSGCTLNCPGARHLEPHGTDKPIVLMIGEAPGAEEEREGVPFVGPAGRVLRWRTPEDWDEYLRWTNVCRTRPPNNREPTEGEIESCRPSHIRDIQATKPRAIFGFGNIPLWWALKETGITKWRGRRVPIQIGGHATWFFPMLHPSFILRTRKFTPRKITEYGSDMEFAFAKDLENAFSIVEDLPKPIVHTEAMARSGVEFITGHREGDFDVLVNFLESCYKCDSIGFDYETGNTEHSPRPYAEGSRILSLAISPKLREAFAFPIDHPKAGWTTTEVTTIKQAISDFLHTAPCKKISHNLSFEQEWSAFFFGEGCLRAQPWEDTMSMAYILDERKGSHSLEFQCLEHFGINIKQLSNIDTKKSLLNIPLNKLLTYNAIDAKYHKLLYHALKERLEESGMWEVYRHQLERVPTAVLTQMKGIPVDSKRVDELYLELTSATKALKAEIANTPEAKKFSKLKDKEFNPSSPVQVKFVFNEIIGKHIDTTAHEVLSQLDDPFAKIISDWRSVIKMNSTYVQPFMTQEELCKYGEKEDRSCIWPDGLVHHALSTARTDTWRTSSGNPNIQNQPKHGEANIGGKIIKLKEFRSQISPLNTDERIVSFDFGQIQARNVAMESKDENLVKSFWDRRDIHSDWAERMVRKYPRWVTEGAKAFANDKKVAAHYRQRSKNEFVFASFFGAQAFSSSQRLGIPENIVEKLLEEFWDEFPEVRSWQKRITKNYFKTGYVTGLSGFRRHAPVGTNQLINAPIQADESIIVLDAMIRLSKIDRNKLQANAEIHDDLWFIWHKKEIDKLSEIVIDEMLKLSFPWINVPLVVERSIGEDWANMIEDNEKYASDTWSK